MNVEPHRGTNGLIRREGNQYFLSPPCEDSAGKQLSVNKEEGSHQNLTMLAH